MQKIIPGFTVSNPVDRKKGNVTDMAKKNTYDAGSISVLDTEIIRQEIFVSFPAPAYSAAGRIRDVPDMDFSDCS